MLILKIFEIFPKNDTKHDNNEAFTSMMKKYTYRFLKSPNDESNTDTIFQSSQNNSRLKFIYFCTLNEVLL